jgi:hypothetical protein
VSCVPCEAFGHPASAPVTETGLAPLIQVSTGAESPSAAGERPSVEFGNRDEERKDDELRTKKPGH